MSSRVSEFTGRNPRPFTKRVNRSIPDPVIIFIALYLSCSVGSWALSGFTFSTPGPGGEPVEHTIRNMLSDHGIRWMFENLLLNNWLAFGEGVLGMTLICLLGIGVAEESGLLTAIIKRASRRINHRWLPILLVFLGIISSIASDVGYLVLIPLAGLLYAGLEKNPLIGMGAAFAGVSAGCSANFIPVTPADVIIGVNTRLFAENQAVPFVRSSGEHLNAFTMHYWFNCLSVLVLTLVGGLVTQLILAPKYNRQKWIVPRSLSAKSFYPDPCEREGMQWALAGLIISSGLLLWLIQRPLSGYYDVDGSLSRPWLNNLVLLTTLTFVICGVCYGTGTGRFSRTADIVNAMTRQMNVAGYILVLTFFCYNFLSLLSYSGMGIWFSWIGVVFLKYLGLETWPVLLIIGFIFITAVINLFVGGMSSKWMVFGPVFVPMLYQVNADLTPDFVSAAYRVGDSSTNIVTPMMTYAGVILAMMRKYCPSMGPGDMVSLMWPYAVAFLLVWSALLISFFVMEWPLGF
ncbi:AbgT family transporter [Sansalvadorimonas sp. 2012CJ34-2]|uniref:AbgT family transporter n=1 Tax=Parendozoicomonas callyspongiae TaxID=2942213 RepID=A0ABT0PKI3_9GAMM|nr:AbgT family transporter [Sansalvadorimonas sp. 2012CJ34-2]MCL6271899.1 AbgT family transporter [Sansalvadorimonas sp. 2012CJ34-2]